MFGPPLDAGAVRRVVELQLDALISRLGIAGERPRRLFHAIAGTSLNGPFHDGRRRLSAISRDGVPFQWSVSAGERSSALRFITDCGVLGMSISERVRVARATLEALAGWLPLGGALVALEDALVHLLPPARLLDETLMGLCIAAELARDGTPRLKVYVNTEIGSIDERLGRVAACLGALDRPGGRCRLAALAHAAGDRLIPAFIALDLASNRIGRLKLYLRPTEGTPALQALAAEAAGCVGASAALAPLHDEFLAGPAYPLRAVDMSVEFPDDDAEPGFKVDLRTLTLLGSDAEADRRIRRLLARVGCTELDYCAVRDIVVGTPSPREVQQIVFVGLAARRGARQVDVYFHPTPSRTESL